MTFLGVAKIHLSQHRDVGTNVAMLQRVEISNVMTLELTS